MYSDCVAVIPPNVSEDTPHVESKSAIICPPCVSEDTPRVNRKALRRVKFDLILSMLVMQNYTYKLT